MRAAAGQAFARQQLNS